MLTTHRGSAAKRRPILATALAATALVGLATSGVLSTSVPGARATTTLQSGAFAAGPSNVTNFGVWRGTATGVAHAFAGGGTWADIEIPSNWATYWGNSTHASHMLITIPMLPKDTTTTIQRGAAGAYDAYWKLAAQHLVAAHMGNAIIRVGHEFNQKWPRWSARTDPASYAAYFRHIVSAMRSVSGQSFRFTWCPSSTYMSWDPTPAYPGDGYVDIVSVDSYDSWYNHTTATPEQRWSFIVTANHQGGLNYWASFAALHNKPMGFAEWALVNKDASMAAGGGGGDDPYYIQQMHDFIAAHNVAYESYFEKDAPDGSHMLEGVLFPQAALLYKSLW